MFEIEEKIRNIVEKIYKKLDLSPRLFSVKINHIVDSCVSEAKNKNMLVDNIDKKFVEQVIFKHII